MNGIRPMVSIVVPVFNGCKTIADCLDSLFRLDYDVGPMEVIVVDNASSDRTAEILRKYGDRIRLLTETTRGPSAARNCGIRAACGEFIALTDADCQVHRDWLQQLLSPLQDNAVGIVGGRILSMRPCEQIELFGEQIHDHQKAIEVFDPPYVISMNWASPRKVLLDSGLFDESYLRCEDVDLSQKIIGRGYRAVYQREAIIYHRNERSLAGLMREGFQHGVWSVKHNKKHHTTNMQRGHKRFNFQSYRQIGSDLLTAASSGQASEQRWQALFQATFETGKKFGKATGSIRFRYLDL